MPASVVVAVAAIVGMAGGALLPLVAYRLAVPAQAPDRTRCGECGAALPGWVRLRARCDQCGAWWGPRAWYAAPVAAVGAALLAWAVYPDPALPLYVALAVLGVLLAAIDLACQRLPHVLVLPAIGLSVVGFTAVAALTGQWPALLRALAGAAALGVLFGLLHVLGGLLGGQGLGFGDVTLGALLGLYVGWLGWGPVVLGALLPWLLNGPVVVALLLAGRVTRKSSLPFGPALLGGCVAAIAFSAWWPMVGRP